MTENQNDLAIITGLRDRLVGPNGAQELKDLLASFSWLQYDEKDFVIDPDKLKITEDGGEYDMIAPAMSDGASYRLTIEYTYTKEANRLEAEQEIDTVFFVDIENGLMTGSF